MEEEEGHRGRRDDDGSIGRTRHYSSIFLVAGDGSPSLPPLLRREEEMFRFAILPRESHPLCAQDRKEKRRESIRSLWLLSRDIAFDDDCLREGGKKRDDSRRRGKRDFGDFLCQNYIPFPSLLALSALSVCVCARSESARRPAQVGERGGQASARAEEKATHAGGRGGNIASLLSVSFDNIQSWHRQRREREQSSHRLTCSVCARAPEKRRRMRSMCRGRRREDGMMPDGWIDRWQCRKDMSA